MRLYALSRFALHYNQPARGNAIMLSDADRKKAADILMNAEKERKQAVQLSKTWPDIAIEDSYA
jgi:hypothetical protein